MKRLSRRDFLALAAGAAAWPRDARAAAGAEFTTFADVRPVLDWLSGSLPSQLTPPAPAKWDAWNRKNDQAIRARLDVGGLDSMVNLLLFGTSFTTQPRIRIEDLAQKARGGVLNARVSDLVHGLEAPAENERLAIIRGVLTSYGIHFDTEKRRNDAGVFILKNLARVLEEKKRFAARSDAAVAADKSAPAPEKILAERAELFRDRGVSLDTGILPDFSVDLALRSLKEKGDLRPGGAARAAVIGPGLAFIDKDESAAFDYFPPQTIQPFAVMDSLLRLELAHPGDLSLLALDISPLVLGHLQRARQQAQKGAAYQIQLPQDAARIWPADLEQYWARLGDRIGTSVEPLKPPPAFAGLKTRAVRVQPEIVLRCVPTDFDMVAQRLSLSAAAKLDVVVATNVFLYYDRFQQSLALESVAAMLKPGGVLLANDQLPLPPSSGMRQISVSAISDGATGRDAIAVYRKA